MGRHAAGDGDAMHPVVAAALARRAADDAGSHREVAGQRYATQRDEGQRDEGQLGWPGEPRAPGGGLGWPGGLTPTVPARPASDGTDGSRNAVAPRRGWRRLFGLDRAA